MRADQNYTVQSLHRYPVKSMAGEAIGSIAVTERGLLGDRVYALVDTQADKVGSAKDARRFGQLLNWRAEFVEQFTDARASAVRLKLPDGRILKSTDTEIDSSQTPHNCRYRAALRRERSSTTRRST
jgi:uncharacterized protein YcbX